MVKTDLPKVMGFDRCELFLLDRNQGNLYSFAIDEESESMARAEGPEGFELDYIIEERQIVRFPLDMGVTGYCIQNDAIGMLNDFHAKHEDKTNKLVPRITSLRQNHFSELAQSFIGHRLAE